MNKALVYGLAPSLWAQTGVDVSRSRRKHDYDISFSNIVLAASRHVLSRPCYEFLQDLARWLTEGTDGVPTLMAERLLRPQNPVLMLMREVSNPSLHEHTPELVRVLQFLYDVGTRKFVSTLQFSGPVSACQTVFSSHRHFPRSITVPNRRKGNPQLFIGTQTAYYAAPMEPYRFARTHSFDAFEFRPDTRQHPGASTGWSLDTVTPELTHSIKSLTSDDRLRVSVHLPLVSILEEGVYENHYEPYIYWASAIGASTIILHMEDMLPGSFASMIRPLIRMTQQQNLLLALENRSFTNPSHVCDVFAVLRTLGFDSNAVGFAFDIGHANLCSDTANDYIMFLKALSDDVSIAHLCIHENWGPDDGDRHRIPFCGDSPSALSDVGYRELFSRLKQKEYHGSAIVESFPLDKEGQSALVKAVARLKQIWDDS